MHVIKASFERLSAARFVDLISMVGVYVIWDAQSKARPTYIGEGVVLKRLTAHIDRLAAPLDGYIALIGEEGVATAKADAETVEMLLLEVAERTDRFPVVNEQRGKFTPLDRIFQRHGTLRVNIAGFDPLQQPWHAQRLPSPKRIVLRDRANGIELDHDWRLRRRQR